MNRKALSGWIEEISGAGPGDIRLYERALTHGSTGEPDYQRLEFLGDRVLGLILSDILYRSRDEEAEGRMARRLNALVSGKACAAVAREIGVPDHARLGKQASDDGARESDNVLGDIMEALIGALYIDRGYDAAFEFVSRSWADALSGQDAAPKHPKSALQEWCVSQGKGMPRYRLVDRSGPSHNPRFRVKLEVNGMKPLTAEGASKQEAETEAARAMLEREA